MSLWSLLARQVVEKGEFVELVHHFRHACHRVRKRTLFEIIMRSNENVLTLVGFTTRYTKDM